MNTENKIESGNEAESKWKITFEYETNGEDGDVLASITGDWGWGNTPQAYCIASTMGFLMNMILASGSLIQGDSDDRTDSVEVFSEIVTEGTA